MWHALPGRILPVVAACLILSCSLAPGRVPPVLESVRDMPGGYSGSEADGSYEPLEWWKAFKDPVLDRVVEEVLASNFDLAEAVARVQQARMRERIAKSVAFPSLQASAGVNDSDTPTNAGIGAQLDELGLGTEGDNALGISLPDRLGLTTYNLSAGFSYELDFWGRNRNDARAAGAALLATESDYLSARMGVLSETVRTYLEIVNLRRQQQLSAGVVDIYRQLETLARSRYDRGLIDARGLSAARRSLQVSQARLPQIDALRTQAEGRLWVLLGGYRSDLAEMLPDSLNPDTILEFIPLGIPADLLVQRPDVGAARQRVEAARFTVGARRADLLPRLSLQGSIGLQSTDADEWFDPDQWFRNLTVNLLGPVFQGSRLRANVALAESRLDEAAAAYGRSVVSAVNEVETALSGLETSRRRHMLLVSHLEEAEAETALQEERYVAGVGDFEGYLTSEQILLDAQSLLAAAQRDLGYARLALHRALGGAWIDSDKVILQRQLQSRSLPPPPTE